LSSVTGGSVNFGIFKLKRKYVIKYHNLINNNMSNIHFHFTLFLIGVQYIW